MKYQGGEYSLTRQERKFAEKNHQLIYKFMHQKKLEIDEYYGEAATGYLIAVMEYSRRRDLQKYKFSTIAYRKMHTYIWNEMESNRRYYSHIEFSIDQNTRLPEGFPEDGGSTCYKDFIVEHRDYYAQTEQHEDMRRLLGRIRCYLTDMQQEHMGMKLEGCKMNEIMRKQHISFTDYHKDSDAIKRAVQTVLCDRAAAKQKTG